MPVPVGRVSRRASARVLHIPIVGWGNLKTLAESVHALLAARLSVRSHPVSQDVGFRVPGWTGYIGLEYPLRRWRISASMATTVEMQ